MLSQEREPGRETTEVDLPTMSAAEEKDKETTVNKSKVKEETARRKCWKRTF